jgi:hypothetical protein
MPENAVDLVGAKTNVGRALMSIARTRALTVSTSSDIVLSVEVDSVSFSLEGVTGGEALLKEKLNPFDTACSEGGGGEGTVVEIEGGA